MAVTKVPSEMDNVVLEVRDLTKRYPVAQAGGLKLFRRNKSERNGVLALDNISFNLYRGEVLGIIGRNGAGKSTLLRILAGITAPTSGSVTIRGRFSSILEIGTGFHPDLTGRENIFLNGELLGFSRKEIAARFDQIVAFSGVGEFIDMPLKQYSNGMFLRLAFSVAFHSDIEILLLDEVLAVGDAEFQIKSYERIQELVAKGASIILVSHNLSSVSRMCSRVIQVDRGKITSEGKPQEILAGYAEKAMENLQKAFDESSDDSSAWDGNSSGIPGWNSPGNFRLLRVSYYNEGKTSQDKVINTLPIILEVLVDKLDANNSLQMSLRVMDVSRSPLLADSMALRENYTYDIQPVGHYLYKCKFPAGFFSHGFFPLAIIFARLGNEWISEITNVPGLRIYPDMEDKFIYINAQIAAPIRHKLEWDCAKI